MKMEMIIRRFAGSFILISLLLAHYQSPLWLLFTAFVGFNLLQSSFTNFCSLEIVLKKFGVGGSCFAAEAPPTPSSTVKGRRSHGSRPSFWCLCQARKAPNQPRPSPHDMKRTILSISALFA